MNFLICALTLALSQPVAVKGAGAWVLVHSCDEVARAKLSVLKTLPEVLRQSRELGYEPVVDGKITYLYPIPSWSLDARAALIDFIDGNLASSTPRPIADLPRHQADHLREVLKSGRAGGELGAMMRATKAGKVALRSSVDVTISVDGRDVVIPVSDGRLTKLIVGPTQPALSAVAKDPAYPRRPELQGLMTSGFALSPSFANSPASLKKLADRALDMLLQRRQESRAALLAKIEAVIGRAELGRQLQDSSGVTYASLPQDIQAALRVAVEASPEAFGARAGLPPEDALRSAMIRVPQGGVRLVIEFLLDGSLPASDGTPVRYRVGWEVKDLIPE